MVLGLTDAVPSNVRRNNAGVTLSYAFVLREKRSRFNVSSTLLFTSAIHD